MERTTLKSSDYTLDASEKKITLGAPYHELDLAQIIYIKNLTTGDVIYDCQSNQYSITLSGADITYTYDNGGHSDSDKLRIIVETELIYTDADSILFENIPVPGGAIIGDANPGIEIRGHAYKELHFDAIQSFIVSVQVTDDNISENPRWRDLCDHYGVVITYTLSGNGTDMYGRVIPIYVKGIKMRVIAKNNSATEDTPYCGVI